MSLRTALAALMSLETALTITEPIPAHIKRAYRLSPGRQDKLSDLPCWMHSWDFTGTQGVLGLADGLGTLDMDLDFTINAQLFVKDSDLDRAADIATAFLQSFLVALARDDTLGGTVYHVEPRGGIKMLEWAGEGYPGLDLFLDTSLRIV